MEGYTTAEQCRMSIRSIGIKARLYQTRKPSNAPAVFPAFDESIKGHFLPFRLRKGEQWKK